MRQRINFRREVLLVEIERRCRDARCNARGRIGLTKAEARVYDAWTCERCEQRWDDSLSERDVPEWWEELTLTGLEGLRPLPSSRTGAREEASEVVARLSDAWRRARAEDSGGAAATQDPNAESSETSGADVATGAHREDVAASKDGDES